MPAAEPACRLHGLGRLVARGPRIALGTLLLLAGLAHVATAQDKAGPGDGPVSYYRHVRPILQRHCSGCHQPLKKGGQLLLTSFDGFRKGGENGPGFLPGKPDDSLVIQYVSGDKPEMPRNAEPLKKTQIDTLARWIKEGAKDDTPEDTLDVITAANPPRYASPPVVTALDYSPDGTLLAVSGYHETLLHSVDGKTPPARLVGRSQRIESLRFSPDGKTLAVVGGTPSLFGEVQLWDVATKKQLQSATYAADVLFGASFDDAGKHLAFGAADNRARVVDLAKGLQDGTVAMRLDAHSDWVLGTTFSLKLDHLITVSRDMSMKLSIVANGQFVDNITSITPGALKGGLGAVERHPTEEQVLCGGADGEPKLYKIFRTQARVIGDDFNRIRGYEPMPGRIVALRFAKGGGRFVAGSSDATTGAARIYDTAGPKLFELPGIGSPVFAVAFRPDGKQVAVAGFDGTVRLYDAATGQPAREFVPVEVTKQTTAGK